MNSFGKKLRLTTFGESHGPAMGGVIDGFPSGFKFDFEKLQKEIDLRKPGNSRLVTQRKESDIPEFLSGINPEGVTLGTPIGFIIRNTDTRSKDYSDIEDKYRPNHADYTYDVKYGIRDFRGGGRASARETVNWVVAGGLAMQWLEKTFNIRITTLLSQVGKVSFTNKIIENLSLHPETLNFSVPQDIQERMDQEILEAKTEGDSIGGIVTCLLQGLPAGKGDPVFDKLQARLAQAMMSINAAKGFEYGYGFKAAESRGSDILDCFFLNNHKVKTDKNYSGGIQGGISNGMPIYFNVAFKPTPTLLKEIPTLTSNFETTTLKMQGRHDPCVAVRAVPVVKALTSLVIADILL